ncbi:MAG TPA: putative sulfate exporter family transporter [Amycolatopsis sp.]|nr:putative sulfate exporter family transporter [Amycolatopsis sp.]
MAATVSVPRLRNAVSRSGTVLPGLVVVVIIAAVAFWLGRRFPVVGGPVFGIVAGACAGPLLRKASAASGHVRLRPGFSVAGKQVLQLSIVMLGTGLSLSDVLHAGGRSLPVLVSTLSVTLGGTWVLSRLLRVDGETAILVGAGTGICGASAIAAVTAVTGAAQARVAYALGTIFTFNIAAVALFPPAGHYLGLSQQGFGLWAGTAINDTSSVVAAAYTYGTAAGAYAVVVKLTRSLAIVPLCLVLQARQARRAPAGRPVDRAAWRSLPLFVVGFLLASIARTVGIIPGSWHPALAQLAAFLICVALTGIGLTLEFAHVRRAGPRPLLLGAMLWAAVAGTSLGVQALTGQL